MRRDRYGNYFFWDEEMFSGRQMNMNQPNQPRPIETEGILLSSPEKAWMDQVGGDLRPKMNMTLSQLYLKVNEEAKAFPFIEKLAVSHPDKTRELVKEFLRVWTRNHDLNASRNQTDPYMFMYGFERRAEGIPLTRSKQERNLLDLAGWVERMRGLRLGEMNEDLLAKAFTTCHSSAEVYRIGGYRKGLRAFGRHQAARRWPAWPSRCAETWSACGAKSDAQNDKKTNRKPKDIQVEVMRGYGVAQDHGRAGDEEVPRRLVVGASEGGVASRRK